VDGTFDRDRFDRALNGLAFDAAAALLETAGDAERGRLAAELELRREGAREAASNLHQRLERLAEEGVHEAVLEVDADPSTRPLLSLLDPAARSRAELRLREARRWRDGRRAANERRLVEAGRALDALDLKLARGLAQRIEGRFLDEQGRAGLDDLLLRLTARSMELEELEAAAPPPPPPRPKRRWFRRG
jgi:hypothetical protein